jgi:hypothetical protein
MYSITDDGILKHIETWQVIVPLHDNDGNPFDKPTIDAVLTEISLAYPGLTVINCTGYWRGQDKLYVDENLQLLIDAVPVNPAESASFFSRLKDDLRQRLHQEKVYVTKQGAKEELLSFDEFLGEVGIDPSVHGDTTAKRRLATRMVSRVDLVVQRLGYETVTLQRDRATKKILWERRICGLTLRSVFDDPYPGDVVVVAADQIERLGALLAGEDSFALVGHYEYQFYALDKHPFRPLVPSTLEPRPEFKIVTYLSPDGRPLTVARFVEHFTMSIAANLFALRDHGFQPSEISINVGSDGSAQITKGPLGTQVMVCPAAIPDEPVQHEIIRCVGEVTKQMENGTLDPIAVQQAKATNAYVLKRAFMKQFLPKQ